MSGNETLRSALAYVGGGGLLSAVEAVVAPPREPPSPLSPPPPLIGIVWSALFAALGVARGRLHGHPREQRRIDGLWLLCVTYPLYTGGLRWRGAAYAGNVVIAATAARIAQDASPIKPDAARLVATIVPWVAWTTLALLTERSRAR